MSEKGNWEKLNIKNLGKYVENNSEPEVVEPEEKLEENDQISRKGKLNSEKFIGNGDFKRFFS